MLRLTREVRFTVPAPPAGPGLVMNGLAGNLLDSAGIYFALQVTLEGALDPRSNYIENIKVIDERVRHDVAPSIAAALEAGKPTLPRLAQLARRLLRGGWNGVDCHAIRLFANPYFSCMATCKDLDMVYLTQRFEFSAAHRLHNPALDDATNREVFGKCNNEAGHGHNYEFEVTLAGAPDASGRLISAEEFTHRVNQYVVERFDHKHLNAQTAEFAKTIPTVENIAKTIYELLDGQFPAPAKLHSIKVWETPKTYAEYSGK